MAAEEQRAPRVARGQTSMAATFEAAQHSPRALWNRYVAAPLGAGWRRIEPGVSVDRENSIERWDARGEGPATAVSFEGFGVTLFLVAGRTPKARRS